MPHHLLHDLGVVLALVVTHYSYSIETAGTLDMDSELKIWTSGRTDPIQKTLKRGANIRGIQAAIAGVL